MPATFYVLSRYLRLLFRAVQVQNIPTIADSFSGVLYSRQYFLVEEERTTKEKGENPERKREGQNVEREDKRKVNSKRLKKYFPSIFTSHVTLFLEAWLEIGI